MSNKVKSRTISRWALKRSFRFEAKAPIEEVTRVLARLEEEVGFVKPFHHKIVIPVGEGYTFGYRAQTGRNHWDTVIPEGEGRVWQATNGHIIVEGTAEVDSLVFYIYIGISMLAFIIPGLILPGAVIFAAR